MARNLAQNVAADTQFGQRIQRLADADAVKGRILVARIIDPVDAPFAQVAAQLRAVDAQQRAQPFDARAHGMGRHGRQPVHAGAPGKPHHESLCLIVCRMTKGNRPDVMARGPIRHEPVARIPGRGLQVAGAIPIGPLQGVMRNPQRRAAGGDPGGFLGGACAQAMIHGDRAQRQAARVGHVVQQVQQCHGIAAARYRDAQSRGRQRAETCGDPIGQGRAGHGIRDSSAPDAPLRHR